MRILRYLASDVLTHTIAVAVVLFLVVFSGRFIRYLAEAAVGDIAADVLLPVLLFRLPSFFELILPLALFIGVLLALGRLYADSEMVIMKACGFSPWRLAGFLQLPALCVLIAVAGLSLYLAPTGAYNAQRLLDDSRSSGNLRVLTEGRFKRQQDGELVTYAERIDDNGIMHDVFLAQRDNRGNALSVTRAKEAEIMVREGGVRYLELRNGTRYRGEPGSPDYEATQFVRYGELIPERQGSVRARTKTEALPTHSLWQSHDPRHRAALYWRLSLPALVPVVTLMALALSRTDARRGRYARLGPALAVFLVYFVALTQARSAVENGGSGALMVGVHLMFFAIALVMLQWEIWTKRIKRGPQRAA